MPQNKSVGRGSDTQRGSAIVYVFIGIILFVALAFVFSRTFQGSDTTMSAAKAKTIASATLDYSQRISRSVTTLLANGCSETELDFSNFRHPTDVNFQAPADGSCNVFGNAGGKAPYTLTTELGAAVLVAPIVFKEDGDWLFTANTMSISGIGNAALNELIMFASNIDQQVCIEINRMLGITNPSDYPPRDATSTLAGTHFGLSASDLFGNATAGSTVETSGDELTGRSAGCYVNSLAAGTDRFYFYQVLVVK
jgi:hypothetical protein